jgi:hypothetical protein
MYQRTKSTTSYLSTIYKTCFIYGKSSRNSTDPLIVQPDMSSGEADRAMNALISRERGQISSIGGADCDPACRERSRPGLLVTRRRH